MYWLANAIRLINDFCPLYDARRFVMECHRPMPEITYLKTECQHCKGHIEYPSELAGESIECPHCKQMTTLPPSTPTRPITSIRNRLPGTIEKIVSDKVVSELVIRTSAGDVASIITTGSVKRMNLKEGDKVFAIIKATEVSVEKE